MHVLTALIELSVLDKTRGKYRKRYSVGRKMCVGESSKSWMGTEGVGYYQNVLYTCMVFSKNKYI